MNDVVIILLRSDQWLDLYFVVIFNSENLCVFLSKHEGVNFLL